MGGQWIKTSWGRAELKFQQRLAPRGTGWREFAVLYDPSFWEGPFHGCTTVAPLPGMAGRAERVALRRRVVNGNVKVHNRNIGPVIGVFRVVAGMVELQREVVAQWKGCEAKKYRK